jgi:DNA-binding NarL/FixJ family response regulator
VISRNSAGELACDDAAVEIALAVVDDHPAIALAVQAAIQSEPPADDERPIRVVGTARTIEQAGELLRRDADRPDIVLCDIQLETGIDGLDVVEAANRAGVRAIVLTSFDRSSLMRAAFERGASGFLDKRSDPAEILAAVRAVAEGGTAFSAANLDAARSAARPPSSRELEVIGLIQRGATSDEIGGRLGISTRTVESHLRRLFDRYGVVSRAELAVLALNEGWVETRG